MLIANAAGMAEARREFGLRAPSRDPELERLLALGRWLGDDLHSAVALSGMTGSRIRETFPAHKTDIALIPCVSGLDLEADMADIFAASCALGRLQEEADFDAFMTLVKPGDVVVDVGANFGLYAAHAALYAGAEGQVFAFEPGPDAFAILQANMARNGLEGRGAVVRAAVGPANGHAQFRLAADSAFSGLRDTGRSTTVGHVDVEVCALDGYAPLAGRAVDLIKIDTEGGEAGVLAGAHDLLARSPDVTVMFEFSHKNLDADGRVKLIAELKILRDIGFELFTRNHDRLDALAPDELVGPRSENLFLTRPGGRAHVALEAAIGLPRRRPTPDQETALEILRRHGAHLAMHNDFCRNIVETAKAALGVELPQQPLLAVEKLAGQLRAAEAQAQAAAAKAQAAEAKSEAAKAQSEAAQAKTEAAKARAEALDEALVSAQAKTEAAKARAETLDKALVSAQARTEAAKARAEALDEALVQASARYDDLRAAHAEIVERLKATFNSRDVHRDASGRLFAEVERLKLRHKRQTSRYKALKAKLEALTAADSKA